MKLETETEIKSLENEIKHINEIKQILTDLYFDSSNDYSNNEKTIFGEHLKFYGEVKRKFEEKIRILRDREEDSSGDFLSKNWQKVGHNWRNVGYPNYSKTVGTLLENWQNVGCPNCSKKNKGGKQE